MNINIRLSGKRVAEVLANGKVLNIRTHEGDEVMIAWVDENGKPVQGRPVLVQSGARIVGSALKDLANLPAIQRSARA